MTKSLEIESSLQSRINTALCRSKRNNRFDINQHGIAHFILKFGSVRHFFAFHNVLEVRHVEVVDQAYLRVSGFDIIRCTEPKVLEFIAAPHAKLHEARICIALDSLVILDDSGIFRKFQRQHVAAVLFFIRGKHIERCTRNSIPLDKGRFRGYDIKNCRTSIPDSEILATHVGIAIVINAINIFDRCKNTRC